VFFSVAADDQRVAVFDRAALSSSLAGGDLAPGVAAEDAPEVRLVNGDLASAPIEGPLDPL